MDLDQENEMLRSALRFYASPKNWCRLVWVSNGKTGFEQVYTDQADAYHDGGVYARKTLDMIGDKGPASDPVEEEKEPEPVVVNQETRDIAAAVVARNQKISADYLGGKDAALNALIGQCMKDFKGRGQPAMVKAALLEQLPRGQKDAPLA